MAEVELRADAAGDGHWQERLTAVRAAHETELLQYPNVVGVSEGVRTRGGAVTSEPVLVVYVQRKVPEERLPAGARLPRQIDGVAVDVVEIGRVDALTR